MELGHQRIALLQCDVDEEWLAEISTKKSSLYDGVSGRILSNSLSFRGIEW